MLLWNRELKDTNIRIADAGDYSFLVTSVISC
jgi:hypothetical protein